MNKTLTETIEAILANPSIITGQRGDENVRAWQARAVRLGLSGKGWLTIRGECLPVTRWNDDKPHHVFGPEDGTLGRAVLGQCHRFVAIPAFHCVNLAAAVYTVLYDRHSKRVQAGLELPHAVRSDGNFDEPDNMAEATGVTRGRKQ